MAQKIPKEEWQNSNKHELNSDPKFVETIKSNSHAIE